jgi:hypothetical protein
VEQHAWALILAGWLFLLLLGLAGGDPFAAARRGREAPAIAFVKWLHRLSIAARQTASRPAPAPTPIRPATESGLHAAV